VLSDVREIKEQSSGNQLTHAYLGADASHRRNDAGGYDRVVWLEQVDVVEVLNLAGKPHLDSTYTEISSRSCQGCLPRELF